MDAAGAFAGIFGILWILTAVWALLMRRRLNVINEMTTPAEGVTVDQPEGPRRFAALAAIQRAFQVRPSAPPMSG